MVVLSAFADEISDDLDEQAAVLRAADISHVDVRGVDGGNVIRLGRGDARSLRASLDRHGLQVAAVATPIGKCAADTPMAELREQIEHAAVLAHVLGTPILRVFAFYPPGVATLSDLAGHTVDRAAWCEAVLLRVAAMSAWASESGVTLLIENDRGTYAETVAGCLDVFTALDSAHLGMVFDAANFLVAGEKPFPDAYQALARWFRHVHVKDISADGAMVVAGRGTARWPDLLRALRADAYAGFLSLEPHLARAGQFGGFTGPELFPAAATALRGLLAGLGWLEDDPVAKDGD